MTWLCRDAVWVRDDTDNNSPSPPVELEVKTFMHHEFASLIFPRRVLQSVRLQWNKTHFILADFSNYFKSRCWGPSGSYVWVLSGFWRTEWTQLNRLSFQQRRDRSTSGGRPPFRSSAGPPASNMFSPWKHRNVEWQWSTRCLQPALQINYQQKYVYCLYREWLKRQR